MIMGMIAIKNMTTVMNIVMTVMAKVTNISRKKCRKKNIKSKTLKRRKQEPSKKQTKMEKSNIVNYIKQE